MTEKRRSWPEMSAQRVLTQSARDGVFVLVTYFGVGLTGSIWFCGIGVLRCCSGSGICADTVWVGGAGAESPTLGGDGGGVLGCCFISGIDATVGWVMGVGTGSTSMRAERGAVSLICSISGIGQDQGEENIEEDF